MSNLLVKGSHGELEVDAATGRVLTIEGDAAEYGSIVRFDLEEWRAFHVESDFSDVACVDILDLGHWTVDGSYTAPEADFRQAQLGDRS